VLLAMRHGYLGIGTKVAVVVTGVEAVAAACDAEAKLTLEAVVGAWRVALDVAWTSDVPDGKCTITWLVQAAEH
jgi:hypothetical protein